jgi:hypothetical protein
MHVVLTEEVSNLEGDLTCELLRSHSIFGREPNAVGIL